MTARVKKWAAFLKRQKTILLFLLILVISFFFYHFAYIGANRPKRTLAFALFGVAFLIFLILFWCLRKYFGTFRSYLVIMFTFGIAFVFINPMFAIPDESIHFYRALEVSEGTMISQTNEKGVGGHLWPAGLEEFTGNPVGGLVQYRTVISKLDQRYDHSQQKVFIEFPSASLYSPVQYTPQAAGIAAARLFSSRYVPMFYAGRVMNLFVCALFFAMAMKILPDYQRYLFILFMNPINLHLAASYSSDGLTTAACILLVCLTLKLAYHDAVKSVSIRQMLALTLLCTLTSLCKITYLPFALIIFIIPAAKFTSKKAKYIFISAAAFICVLVSGGWLAIGSRFISASAPGTDPAGQLEHILGAPFEVLAAILKTWNDRTGTWIFTLFGSLLGRFDIPLSQLVTVVFIGIFLYILLGDNPLRAKFTRSTRGLSVFIMVTTVLLIFLSIYIQFNPIRNNVVDGIQSRYFIPLLIFLPVLFGQNRVKDKDRLDLQCQSVVLGAYIPVFASVIAIIL